jgi:DNA modification methylase
MRDTANKSKEQAPGEGASKPALVRPPRAELVWEGKYNANGKRVAPLRVALPFQTVETVNESAQERQRGFQFGSAFREEAWRDRLIWGDKKYVLPSLLSEFAGKVNLIYIDPPFDTGADFSFAATVPEDPDSEGDSFTFTKEPSIIEHKAYRDTWGRGLESYLQWFYEAVVLLHELLHENGSLYVHLDWHVAHHAKLILDEVFGRENFRNEIIWKRTTARSGTQGINHMHDTILFYSKTDRFTWNVQYTAYSKDYLETMFRNQDASGKRYRESPLTAPGLRSGSSGKAWRGCDPSKIGNGRHWAIPSWMKPTLSKEAQTDSLAALDELESMGRIVWSREGEGRPNFKQYSDDLEGVELQSIWTDFGALSGSSPESMNYPTQKPEALLDRILKCSSNEHDLVLDSFCGSGTTAAVAEKLGRRWIACDLSRFAIHTTRKRLLSISNVRPFVVQNLGKYERQVWAGAEFGDNQAAERQRAYIEFILKLAQATPFNGYNWLHGAKAGRMVHIGAVDAPVSVGDVTQIAAEFKRAIGTGKDAPRTNSVDVLGWDFAFELNEVAKQQASAANIQMRFLRIPRDVMDKRAVEQGDIHFFESG